MISDKTTGPKTRRITMRKITLKDCIGDSKIKMTVPMYKIGDVVSILDVRGIDPIDDPYTVESVKLYNIEGKVTWMYHLESNKLYEDPYRWGPDKIKHRFKAWEMEIELHPTLNTKLGQLL